MKKWLVSLISAALTFSINLAVILAYIATGGNLALMLSAIIVLLGVSCVLSALSIIALARIMINNPNLS